MTAPSLQLPDNLYIGTSGWSYPHWKDTFYNGIKRSNWLQHYSDHFNTLEINASFYRKQSPDTLTRWYNTVADDFNFSLKANRYITHNKKLLVPQDTIDTEKNNSAPLGSKLATVLWQLPGNFNYNEERLLNFVKKLSRWNVRHVIEFRHASWFCESVAACLEEHNISNCLSDAADWPIWHRTTSNLIYIRLHGHSKTYSSAYAMSNLKRWAEFIIEQLNSNRQVYVYFNNDANGHAPRDAIRLCRLISNVIG